MSCFSLELLKQLLIYGVLIGMTFAILNLVVPWAVSKMYQGQPMGEGINMVMRVLMIIFWAVVIIVVIIIVFYLLQCAWGFLGTGPLRLH
jgi:uncharacterized membrane protein